MNILYRFRNAHLFNKDHEIEKVIAAAKRCLSSGDGEILLTHLINEFKLDEPTECLPVDQANWVNGTQFVVKCILSLVNDKEHK